MLLLTEQEIAKISESCQGADWAYQLVRKTESALLEKLKAQEPFGYFKAEPFGWTDCAETDDGAKPLYEHPLPPADVVRDAERYKWLRERNWSDSPLCVVTKPYEAVKLGYDCPSHNRLDAAIDAAMKGMK